MVEAYGKAMKERVFAKGQLVLRMIEHVRRGMARPSKFAPKWERPFIIREANASRYYHLPKRMGMT